MTDPADAATRRAMRAEELRIRAGAVFDGTPHRLIKLGAREALAPLKELHRPHSRPESYYGRSPVITVCNHCLGPKTWPCPTALWLYSDAELNPEGTTP